ncbi:MAG: lysophospholipid acyltransferase family protein [Saprospiraceae bacterium]|nr:lysophospholipid acyltransferase family protein [Saprospiraceae bacterium]MDW8230982.1 lysophospholipid acyltransferase family protein [Saprospiraceae bacterium]
MFSKISALLLRWWGWKVVGRYPYDVPKLVMMVAPHTSNWDFVVGVLVKFAYRLKASYVGKHTLFRWPFGSFFRWLGGIPVDRSRRNNFVATMVEAFHRAERLHLVLSPEGTRKKVERFKTGFYHIARSAGVPIALCKFDWARKEVYFDPQLFWPTDDEGKDLAYLWNYYKGVVGRIPSQGVF